MEHLFEVVDLSSVDLRVDVLEGDFHKVRSDQVVELSLRPIPETFEGRVAIKKRYLIAKTTEAVCGFVKPLDIVLLPAFRRGTDH